MRPGSTFNPKCRQPQSLQTLIVKSGRTVFVIRLDWTAQHGLIIPVVIEAIYAIANRVLAAKSIVSDSPVNSVNADP